MLGSSSTLPPAQPSPLPRTSPCRQRALSRARTPSTHKDPFGRLRTAASLSVRVDPTSSALHPRLSLRATRFVSRCGFHRHRLPRQTLLLGFCSTARPADTSRGSQVPSLSCEVIGRRTSEDARRSRALVRGAALLRTAEPRPKVFPDTLRRSRALHRGGEHHDFESRKPRPRFSMCPAKGPPRLQVECLPPPAPGHGPPFEGLSPCFAPVRRPSRRLRLGRSVMPLLPLR